MDEGVILTKVSEDSGRKASSTKLSGNLGLFSIVFMVLAAAAPLTVVGAPVPLAFAIGNGAGVPAAFIITGIVLVFFAIGFTTMTPFVPSAGAFYSYAFKGIGRKAGIGTGYAALVSYFTLYVGVFALLGTGTDALVRSFGGPGMPWWIWALLALALISFLGYRNIELSGRVLTVLLIAEVVIVVALDAAIIFAGGGEEGFSTAFLDPSVVFSGAPGVAFLFAVLGFIGIEATAVFRNEAKEPNKTIPRATYIAVAFIGLFYALTSWAMVSAIGDSNIVDTAAASSEAVLPDLSTKFLGQAGTHIVAILFVTSIFASLLTFHNVVARYVFSLSNRELLPKSLGKVHQKFGSPHIASLVGAAGAVILIALGVIVNLDPIAEFYTWLVGLASLGYVVLLVVTSLAVLTFFRKNPAPSVSKWRTLVAPAISLLGLLGFLVLILMNLMLLVGDNLVVAVAVVVLLIGAFVAGWLVGIFRPQSGWEDLSTEAI